MNRIRIIKILQVILFIKFYYLNINGLTVDNQLVSLKNDCFERIALGAMLPFEKTFRVEDTNSLRICKELCSRAGEKCQTLAFGVHIRGNGTCQLSSEKIATVMNRPVGTIFDPDFDLYSRKINCFDVGPNNDVPSSPGGSFGTTPLDDGRPNGNRPPPPPFGTVSTTLGSTYPSNSDTTAPDRYSPRPTVPPSQSSPGSNYPSTSSGYPSSVSSSHLSTGLSSYPSTNGNYPSSGSSYPPTGVSSPSSGSSYPTSGSGGTTSSGNGYSVHETNSDRNYPRPLPNNPTTYTYYTSDSERDKMYFSNDYPLYKYPSLYENTYPTSSNYPGTYAPNAAPIDDRYKPPSETYDYNKKMTPKPMYGLGYGNGYSYGTPTDYRGGSSSTGVAGMPISPGYYDRPDYNKVTSGSIDYMPANTPYDRYPMPDYSTPDYRPSGGYDTSPNYNKPTDSRPTNGYNQGSDRPNNNGYNSRPADGNYGERPDRPVDGNYGQRPDRPPDTSYGQRPDRPSDSSYGQRPDRLPDTTYGQRPYQPSDKNYGQKPDRPSDSSYGPRPDGPTDSSYGQRPQRPSEGSFGQRPDYSVRPLNERPTTQTSGYGTSTIKPPIRGTYDYNTTQLPPSSGYDNLGNGYNKSRPGSYSPPGSYRPPGSYSPPGSNIPPGSNSPPGSYGPPPEGKYHRYDDHHFIKTYFNPDYYFRPKWTTKPVSYLPRGDGQDGGYNAYDDQDYVPGVFRTCFRRVLAGKRIAPHWVRRTLACERVEDCMKECEYEKRFQCEGFNYRIDPSGHGQGDCELIEVPLAEMDLYSSTHQRDTNLLRHPDYDYYERDRNAPSSCRQACKNCGGPDPKPISSPPAYFRPADHFSSGDYGGSSSDRYRPPISTAVDKYRPPPPYESRPLDDFYGFSSHGSSYPSSYDRVDHYDVRPNDPPSVRPDRWESLPSSHGSSYGDDYHSRPMHNIRPDNDRPDHYRPPYRPGSDYSPYRSQHQDPLPPDLHRCGPPPCGQPPSYNYIDRGDDYKKPTSKFVPYLIDSGSEFSSSGRGNNYGGSYSDYWGIGSGNRRKDSDFNYFDLGPRRRPPPSHPSDNSVLTYPGSKYIHDKEGPSISGPPRDRFDYRSQWTRRPGPDECSVKTSEGFRFHKNIIRLSVAAPTLTECEKHCSSENKFICHTYSYRYSTIGRENCLLCDRPLNALDYYVDIEPDRDYDIYSMSDESKSCRALPDRAHGSDSAGNTAISDPRNNDQCFFRAIDATRFYKSIVRDSLTVRSIGQCELECIKAGKFTCRAFAFRYGQKNSNGIIDNCQLSDWPVRDMDKERHLILDPSFDVFERASYGHGCEIQPIVDDKHKKLCYLGYGSPAKLLAPAIKKIISVPSELECKRECIRFRENTPFKCYSFSYGSQASTFNCELSDLDQSELKLNIHYANTHEKDYWLFAWNPFDWTCRDKVATIGGNRVNNDRRMDIFRQPGDVTWRHYTVSGKPCRIGSDCDKNLVTGFYSCETDGAEIGSWDYCCKADYPCGYSKGFDYPWCFVGDEPDQWRKCSDHYFPGNQTHAGITLPPKDDSNKKKHDQFQRPPRPGGLQSLTDFTTARLWPVTYLYSEGPPNSTELSNFVDCNKESC